MNTSQRIFESRGFDFRRDFTESVFKRVLSGETICFSDMNGDNDVFVNAKPDGILIRTWNAHIGIHNSDIEKGYEHIMEIYDEEI